MKKTTRRPSYQPFRAWCLLLAAACACLALALPAGGALAQDVGEDEVVSISTSEVLLPVTVRNGAGRLVTNLRREDFRVFEDGQEQHLRDLAVRRVPVDVALLVDASSSVAANLDDFRRAVEEFAEKLAPEDRVCLVKFDDRVELLLDWTSSRLQLRRALRRVTPGVFTRFNDALLLTGREMFRERGRRRRAVVVLSDGIDSGRGAVGLEAALRSLLEAQAATYAISNTAIERGRKRAELDALLAGTEASVRFNELRADSLRESLRVLDASEESLARLAAATGGRLHVPTDFGALEDTYAAIAEELRHQYALYYGPSDPSRDGRFRRVRVEVPGRNYQVTARAGYFAPRKS